MKKLLLFKDSNNELWRLSDDLLLNVTGNHGVDLFGYNTITDEQ
jgi:hypothetical protein